MRKAPHRRCWLIAAATLLVLSRAAAADQPAAKVPIPEPTVPERFTLEGEFVRLAYNNEGYVTLGYRTANASVGEEWMVLYAGMTVRKGVPTYELTREAISLKTPDGKTIPLASQEEYNGADLRGLQAMADASRDTFDYFPPDVTKQRPMVFFSETGSGTVAFDRMELDYQTGAVGRLYFRVPGGIQVGQHWLVVRFAGSVVEVPFRILTKEEEKQLRKNWKDIKTEHEGGTR